MTVIVVPVNGTLSYVELPLSKPQQLAGAHKINLPRFSQLAHFLSLPATTSSLYYRFMVYAARRRKRLTKPEHEPFIFLCNKKRFR